MACLTFNLHNRVVCIHNQARKIEDMLTNFNKKSIAWGFFLAWGFSLEMVRSPNKRGARC